MHKQIIQIGQTFFVVLGYRTRTKNRTSEKHHNTKWVPADTIPRHHHFWCCSYLLWNDKIHPDAPMLSMVYTKWPTRTNACQIYAHPPTTAIQCTVVPRRNPLAVGPTSICNPFSNHWPVTNDWTKRFLFLVLFPPVSWSKWRPAYVWILPQTTRIPRAKQRSREKRNTCWLRHGCPFVPIAASFVWDSWPTDLSVSIRSGCENDWFFGVLPNECGQNIHGPNPRRPNWNPNRCRCPSLATRAGFAWRQRWCCARNIERPPSVVRPNHCLVVVVFCCCVGHRRRRRRRTDVSNLGKICVTSTLVVCCSKEPSTGNGDGMYVVFRLKFI